MKEYPINFPTFWHHMSDWVIYKMTKSFPFGLPFERYDGTQEIIPNGRLTCVSQIADQDATRLRSLLNEAEERNLRKDIFGRAAFTVQMISPKAEDKDKDAGLP